MRLKHIYITKEGEPMANPEMEYPENPKDKEPVPKIQKIWKHGEDLEKYHSGLLPFEDREKVKDELFHQVTGGPQIDVPFNVMFKPDTLIPVDLEVEVICGVNIRPCECPDFLQITGKEVDCMCKVLRIKP